jgi:hypothetical protein
MLMDLLNTLGYQAPASYGDARTLLRTQAVRLAHIARPTTDFEAVSSTISLAASWYMSEHFPILKGETLCPF